MLEAATAIAFTSAVKAQQERLGSRRSYARWEERRGFQQAISEELARFIADRDSFYLGTPAPMGSRTSSTAEGGFLKVVDARTLAFADFGGNRQYISIGNLTENPKTFLFLMDYEHAIRFKLWGTAAFVDDDPELLETLTDPGYGAPLERAIVFRVEAWDKNCRKHIPKLVPDPES